MAQVKILRFIAALLILGGLYMLYQYYFAGGVGINPLAGIGPLIIGGALLVISRSKAFTQKKKTDDTKT